MIAWISLRFFSWLEKNPKFSNYEISKPKKSLGKAVGDNLQNPSYTVKHKIMKHICFVLFFYKKFLSVFDISTFAVWNCRLVNINMRK